MQRMTWSYSADPASQAEALVAAASSIGLFLVNFGPGGDGSGLAWPLVEPWTRSRAVTIAVTDGAVASPALDMALCSDLLYVRAGSRLKLAVGSGPPSPAIIWALGRAGRRALARGLLSTGEMDDSEAVKLGLAHSVLADGESPPVPAWRRTAGSPRSVG